MISSLFSSVELSCCIPLELDVIIRHGSSFMQIVVTQDLLALQIVEVKLDTYFNSICSLVFSHCKHQSY